MIGRPPGSTLLPYKTLFRSVSALSARSLPDGHATIAMVVEVKDRGELEGVINKLNNIQGVYHVARASGK